MDDNCGEGVVSRRWVCLVGVVVRRYIDFLILLIPTPLVSALFCSSIPTCTFCSFLKCFSFFIIESVDSISRDERDCH